MISAVDYKLVRNVTKRSKMSTQYAFWTILTLYHKWVRVSLQNFLSRLRFFAKLFLEILQSRWWSDTKITNLKMCFILRKSLQSRLKLAYKWHIWWFRHVTTNSRESRSRNVFHLSQIFCKNFSGAGCGLTQKPQILKRSWLLWYRNKNVKIGIWLNQFVFFRYLTINERNRIKLSKIRP